MFGSLSGTSGQPKSFNRGSFIPQSSGFVEGFGPQPGSFNRGSFVPQFSVFGQGFGPQPGSFSQGSFIPQPPVFNQGSFAQGFGPQPPVFNQGSFIPQQSFSSAIKTVQIPETPRPLVKPLRPLPDHGPYDHTEENMKRRFLDFYESLVDEDSYPTGWDKEIIPPNRASPEYVRRILYYINFSHYGFNGFTSPNWDQDIFFVVNGRKPISLTENDYSYPFRLPSDLQVEEEPLDLELRYIAVRYMGLKGLLIDRLDDPFVIWYRDENWARAIYYYLYNKKLIDSNQFTASILLGYGYQSTLINVVRYEYTRYVRQSIRNSITTEKVLRSKPQSDTLLQENLKEILDTMPEAELYSIYAQWFAGYEEVINDVKYSRARYDFELNRINQNLELIKENHLFAAYARADSVEDNLANEAVRLFGQ